MYTSMKSIFTINSAITENMKSSIVKERAVVINQNSGCVTRSQCITMFRFQQLQMLLVTFQAKNSIRRAPASSVLTKSHTEAIRCLLQIAALKQLGRNE